MKRYLVPGLLVAMFVSFAPLDCTEQKNSTAKTSPEERGKQIGAMVSAAVDTALPIIGKILDVFKNKKKDEKASKGELTSAVDTAKNDFTDSAKKAFQPAATISRELRVIKTFSSAGVNANASLTTIDQMLAKPSPPYSKISIEWKVAKNFLNDVATVSKEDILAIPEQTIQERINAVLRARKDVMERIDGDISEAMKSPQGFSSTELRNEVNKMRMLLNGFDSLAAIELDILQDDIDKLGKWANGPAGSSLEEQRKQPDSQLMKTLDTSIQAAAHVSQPD